MDNRNTEIWTTERISSLSEREIGELRFDEMIGLVRSAGIRVPSRERLDVIESDALVRLVYMARVHCRKKTAFQSTAGVQPLG